MPEKEPGFEVDRKQTFNIVFGLMLAYQRALTEPLRKGYGIEALGKPSFIALIGMLLWAAFSNDPGMWLWLGFWGLCHCCRRIESLRLRSQGKLIHSWYDGDSSCRRWGLSEKAAKMFAEPVLIGLLGFAVYLLYRDNLFLPFDGLPKFLMIGAVVMVAVEAIKQTIFERRAQAIIDARIEQQQTMNDVRDRYGDS